MNHLSLLPDDLAKRAADWLARRDAGFTPEEAAAFEAWLRADPRHARAVAEIEAAWSLVQRPRDSGYLEGVLADLAARDRVRRVRRWSRAASLLAAAAVVALALWLPSWREDKDGAAPVAPALPRAERQVLADGTVVELNIGAAISVAFTPASRAVTLLRGEAHFEVAKDPARPFVVSAASVEARAVGTAFIVAFSAQEVSVLVTEGRVAVACPAASSAPASAPVIVAAGNRATVAVATEGPVSPQLAAVTPAQIASALAWRPKRLEFTGTPLVDAIALFNRGNSLQLTLADPSLGSLRVSGVFRADDPAGFARLIEPTFSLRTRRVADDRIEIGR